MTPRAAYRALYRGFGPQGWWPVAERGGSRPAYHPGRFKPLSERQALEVALGAILTQNTAWTNVERAISALHEARAVGLRPLAGMPRDRLERLVRPSGYFRQKAERLKVFVRRALKRGSVKRWLTGSLPALREELLALKGVGPETADSILLYAGGRPAFVVDAYTVRIGRRVGWLKKDDYHHVQDFFARALPRSARLYQEFHALLVALAKFYCRTEPLCGGCPLREGCAYGLARFC